MGMASAYGNLGTVYQIRGDLTQAEAMYRKALELSETLGHKMAWPLPTVTWAPSIRCEGT